MRAVSEGINGDKDNKQVTLRINPTWRRRCDRVNAT
jgi:hypothetical protein